MTASQADEFADDGGAPRAPAQAATDGETAHSLPLILALGGFDGPIDVLLQLARDQKVDLIHISILQLAEQYLAFVAEVSEQHLELAADYLVMAAWLAYLKSRLLLPPDPADQEPSGEEMAAALQFQLQRLEAIQEAGRTLFARPTLGRDVFARGMPEGVTVETTSVWDATLYDLLRAYADHKRRTMITTLEVEPLTLYTVEEAIGRLERLLGAVPDWTVLSRWLPEGITDPLMRRSALCAHFLASLELTKQGRLDVRQDGGHFSPLHIRVRQRPPGEDEAE